MDEPFKGLFTQGMVCHETYKDENNKWLNPDEVFSDNGKKFFLKSKPSERVSVGPTESMSKSKKNTIDPENIIQNYGADATRLFILSDSPPEKDVQWSDKGIIASYKFIQKFWNLHKKIQMKIQNKNVSENFDETLEEFTNQIINKINISLEKFSYNVIIANLHEVYNFFSKILEKENIDKNLFNNYEKILIIMLPIVPHLASECLSQISDNKKFVWPKINNKFITKKTCTIVVQINAKKRGLILTENGVSEKELMEKIKEMKEIMKFLNNKVIIKTIYINDKLINLIVK